MNKMLIKSINSKPQVCWTKDSKECTQFNFRGKDYSVKPEDIYFTLSKSRSRFLNPEWLPTVDLSKYGV